jgi:hypothetical protein
MSLRGYCRTGERPDRLQAGNEDHQIDDDRQDGALDEQIGERH